MSNAERYYLTGRDTIFYQNTLRREFSDRAFNLLNLGVATSAAVAIVFNLRLDSIRFDLPMQIGLGVWGVAFVLLVLFCIFVMTARSWAEPPYLDQLRNLVAIHMYNEDFVLMSLGDNNTEAVQYNNRVLDGLSASMTRAMAALVAKFLSLIYLLFLIFWRSPRSPVCELAELMA